MGLLHGAHEAQTYDKILASDNKISLYLCPSLCLFLSLLIQNVLSFRIKHKYVFLSALLFFLPCSAVSYSFLNLDSVVQ